MTFDILRLTYQNGMNQSFRVHKFLLNEIYFLVFFEKIIFDVTSDAPKVAEIFKNLITYHPQTYFECEIYLV